MKFTSVYPFREKVFFLFFLQPAVISKAIVSAYTDELRNQFHEIISGQHLEEHEGYDLNQFHIPLSIDCAFEKDYNLLPLSEVEDNINQNKHLPEVPSAKEMQENGINLKEMNLLLLYKRATGN